MNYSTNFGLKLPQRGVEMANVNDLNDNTEDIDTIMHQNRTMLGEAYDPDKADGYEVGDFVVQLGQYYECISDTSGVWDPTAWQLTDIGTVLKALADGGGGGHTYSTAEQVVGKWIDGKDLYEKTFSLSTSMTSGTYSQLDISSLNIDKFVSANGVFNRIVSNLVFWYKFGGYEGSSYYSNIRYDSSSKTLDYIVGYGQSESCNEQIITIRYTKSTTTP